MPAPSPESTAARDKVEQLLLQSPTATAGQPVLSMQPAPPAARSPGLGSKRRTPAPRGRKVGEPLPPLAKTLRSAAAPRITATASAAVRPPRAGALKPAPPGVADARLSLPGSVGGVAPTTAAARHVGGSEKERDQDEVSRLFSSVTLTSRGIAAGYKRVDTKRPQADEKRFVLLVRAATKIQSRWRGLAARRLWLKLKRTVENISWVLVCTTANATGEPSLQTVDLINRLGSKPLQVMHFPSPDRARYYVAVSATDEQLIPAAEDMKLRMFLKPKKIFNKLPGPQFGNEVDVGGPKWFGGTCEFLDSARHEFIPASQLARYIQGIPPGEDDVPLPQELGGPSFFNSGERQRITRHIIENVGDGIDLEDAVERYKDHKTITAARDPVDQDEGAVDATADNITCVREFFPLHHDAEMIYLYQNWASLSLVAKHIIGALIEMTQLRPKSAWEELCKLVHQPLHLIRNYYGERIALYYAFVGAYTRGLMIPMALGLVCQVEYWFGAGYFDFGGIEGNSTGIVYSLLMSLWSVYFLATWSRLESELAFVWGTEHVITNDHTRYAFAKNEENPYIYNPLTETNERSYGSGLRRVAKFLPTVIFVIACVAGVVLAGLVAIYIKAQGSGWNAVGSSLNFLSIVIFQTLYNFVSERLNNWENWQTQDEWDNSFIKKLFLFQFVNNFFFLFFLAYFKYTSVFGTEGSCKFNESKGRDSCMEEVELNMVIVFALKTWGQQIVEVSLPFVKAWARYKIAGCSKKCVRWGRVCLKTRDAAKRISLLDCTPKSAPGTNVSFSALTVDEKFELMDELTVHKYKPGQYIATQGKTVPDEQPALFIISQGLVTVVIDDIEKPITLGVGYCFGERSLLMREPRSASIKAVDHCTVLGLSRKTYRSLGLARLKWKSADYTDLNNITDRSMVLCARTIQSALTQAVTTKVEKEFKLETYSDLDAFKDFNEMVIQFGYITLFAVALPIAPLLAVLNNFFEIRGDAFALCKGSRRRAYQTKQTIGSWYTVLEILSLTAVITNALLTGFVNSTVADLDPRINGTLYSTQVERMTASRLWMWVFVFEHIMLLARTVMQHVVGSEAEWVNFRRSLVKKRIQTDIKLDSSRRVRRRRVSQTAGVVDAFVSQLKNATDVAGHPFSVNHCTVMIRNIPRHLATDNTIARLFGLHGTVLCATTRIRDGVAKCWALVTFTSSATALQAVHQGSGGIFKEAMLGVDHADLLKLTIHKVDVGKAIGSEGAFGQVWRQQAEKADEAYTKFQRGYSTKKLQQALTHRRAEIAKHGGLGGGFPDLAKTVMDSAASKTPQATHAASRVGQRLQAEADEITPPISAAASPTEIPPAANRDIDVSPQPQLHLEHAMPATPGAQEPLESVFARLDVSRDGRLDKAEIGQLLALLRAQATASGADEEWLQPSTEEIASALREMDRDGSETVSFPEFEEWWNRKNHDGEFAASPAMWGLQSSDDEDPPRAVGSTPIASDAVVLDVATFEEDHQGVVALFQKVDADGDGALQPAEVASLLVCLRARATGSDPEEAWLFPTTEEVSKAMLFMDLDGNGSVTLEEFLEWWDVKGGWEYASDPSEWE